MSETAITISLLALVAVIGLWIGHFKIKGVGLGIGGVLFGGILVAHFTTQYGIKLDSHTLHFVQEFGLILFVYTIGIQVGPGFFASLRKSGLTLNGLGILIAALGAVVTILIYKLADIPLDVALGIYSGAVTNTPSLGAGQQILSELGMSQTTSNMGWPMQWLILLEFVAFYFLCGLFVFSLKLKWMRKLQILKKKVVMTKKLSKACL